MTDATTGATNPRVQVVDDDPRLLQAALRLLPRWGFRCDAYSDAQSALAAIERDPPDLLIVDIFMPDMDGFQVIARARRLAPRMRIIAVSGDVIRGEATNVLAMSAELGADATLHKPIRPEALHANLIALLRPPAAQAPAR
ncbi:MAG: response regulator [Thiohalocapsa sp.]|jgi:DNA-binding response OmpR family regulator|uniref:response regulator n=1 Tax=Thiohalocapsa sp. TaxID=2497641 RepID=UPI0025CD8653|nr:response regulator [Thiohalocapsa sp.]MCG6940614.1 response regulator [Thiohalocapsa sp.]